MNKVLISDAKGFIGSLLCKELMTPGLELKVKLSQLPLIVKIPEVRAPDITGKTSWSKVLENVEVIQMNQVNGQKGENTTALRFFAG